MKEKIKKASELNKKKRDEVEKLKKFTVELSHPRLLLCCSLSLLNKHSFPTLSLSAFSAHNTWKQRRLFSFITWNFSSFEEGEAPLGKQSLSAL